MFDGYTFFEHPNPIQSGVKGYILNNRGNIVAYIKLSGNIVSKESEEGRMNNERDTQRN